MKNHMNIFWFMTFHTTFDWCETLVYWISCSRWIYLGLWWKYIFSISGPEKYDVICNTIRCLVSLKSGITYVISLNYRRIKINPWFFACRKTLTFHIVILITPILIEIKKTIIIIYSCYYKMFVSICWKTNENKYYLQAFFDEYLW